MAGKSNFAPEEWAAVRNAPHAVSMAIANAGGGIMGALKEAMAAAQVFGENANNASSLIQSICDPNEVKEAEGQLQQQVMADPANAGAKLQQLAVEYCQAAVAVLSQRAPGEISVYQTFVMTVAETVSKASKEGGFLGFGGEQVSDEEKAAINAIADALRGGGMGASGSISLPRVTIPSRAPSRPQEPAEPEPSEPEAPPAASSSGKFPGMQPKSPTRPNPNQPPPQAPAQPAPTQPAPSKQGGTLGAKPSTRQSSSKDGFKSGTGLKKNR